MLPASHTYVSKITTKYTCHLCIYVCYRCGKCFGFPGHARVTRESLATELATDVHAYALSIRPACTLHSTKTTQLSRFDQSSDQFLMATFNISSSCTTRTYAASQQFLCPQKPWQSMREIYANLNRLVFWGQVPWARPEVAARYSLDFFHLNRVGRNYWHPCTAWACRGTLSVFLIDSVHRPPCLCRASSRVCSTYFASHLQPH